MDKDSPKTDTNLIYYRFTTALILTNFFYMLLKRNKMFENNKQIKYILPFAFIGSFYFTQNIAQLLVDINNSNKNKDRETTENKTKKNN